MLEILKANVLIAYQQMEQYQLDRYGRGVVSAIDRNRDMVVIKTAQQSVLVSLKDDNWERGLDAETISSIRTHIALYRAFPQIGGIARPHARNAIETPKIHVNILPGKFNITSANIANKKKCSLLPELFSPEIKSEYHFCICSTL